MMVSDLHCDLKIDRDDMSFEDQIRCTGEAILEHAEGVCASGKQAYKKQSSPTLRRCDNLGPLGLV
jgi:hypothetical protein